VYFPVAEIQVAPDCMYAGARTQKFVPADLIKWVLTFILIFTGGHYMLSLLF